MIKRTRGSGTSCINLTDESDLYFYSKKRKREGDKKEKDEEDVNVLQGLLVPKVLVVKKGILVSLPLSVRLSVCCANKSLNKCLAFYEK